jgi:hypothetical protein
MIVLTFAEAMRYTQMLLGFAFILQSVEHLRSKEETELLICRIALSAMLIFAPIASWWIPWTCLALSFISIINLHRYNGPYNGGSDRMGLLILFCVTIAEWLPNPRWQIYVFGYLAIQLVLSYFISGLVKVVNADWRSGRALQDVFLFSAYPVSEKLRGFHDKSKLMFIMSWCVMGFELIFPLAMLDQSLLIVALMIAATFHFANACLFGLNRFFWVWLSAYPSIIWLQSLIFLTA